MADPCAPFAKNFARSNPIHTALLEHQGAPPPPVAYTRDAIMLIKPILEGPLSKQRSIRLLPHLLLGETEIREAPLTYMADTLARRHRPLIKEPSL